MSGGGGGGNNTQTVQKADPWSGVQPYLRDMYGRAQSYSQTPQSFYPGQTYAGLSPLQEQGLYGGLDYMQGPYADQAQQYLGSLQGMMDAPQNIASNPAVTGMMDANRQAVTDTLQREWLPSVRRGSIIAGDYGGTKTDLAQGQAIGDAAKALSAANAQTMLGAYGDAVKQASYAAGAMPGAMQLGMAPFESQKQVGGVEQALQQQEIDEAMARHYYPKQDELGRLQTLNNLLQGGMQFGSSTSTTSGPSGGSPLAGAIGGGLLGYGGATMLGAPFYTAAAGLGPLGWGLAGGGALLGGLFS